MPVLPHYRTYSACPAVSFDGSASRDGSCKPSSGVTSPAFAFTAGYYGVGVQHRGSDDCSPLPRDFITDAIAERLEPAILFLFVQHLAHLHLHDGADDVLDHARGDVDVGPHTGTFAGD